MKNVRQKRNGLCSLVASLIALWSGLLLSGCGSSSVAVIGGADGPTAIFLSSGSRSTVILLLLVILVVIIGGASWLYHKKK